MELSGSRELSTRCAAKILSINVGRSKPLEVGGVNPGLVVESGIIKRTVSNEAEPMSVEVRKSGVLGDEQADLSVHGGLDKAVYLYPSEHYGWWESKRAEAGAVDAQAPLPFGALGENLTTSGLTEANLWIGDHLMIGEVELMVEAPRNPCFKLNAVMGYRLAVKHMLLSGRAGVYLSVLKTGVIHAGMPIEIIPGRREESVINILTWRRSRARREP